MINCNNMYEDRAADAMPLAPDSTSSASFTGSAHKSSKPHQSSTRSTFEYIQLAVQTGILFTLVGLLSVNIYFVVQMNSAVNVVTGATGSSPMFDVVHDGVAVGISSGIRSVAQDANPFKAGLAFLLNGTIPLIAKEAFGFNFAATATQIEPYLDTMYSVMKEMECTGHQAKSGCVDRFQNEQWRDWEEGIQIVHGYVKNIQLMAPSSPTDGAHIKMAESSLADIVFDSNKTSALSPFKAVQIVLDWLGNDLGVAAWAPLLPECADFVQRAENIVWQEPYQGECTWDQDDDLHTEEGTCHCSIFHDRTHASKKCMDDAGCECGLSGMRTMMLPYAEQTLKMCKTLAGIPAGNM